METNREPSDISRLTEAATKHGIILTPDQARMAAEWRSAMVTAVATVRQIEADRYEPAAVFVPVRRAEPDGGE